MGIGEGGVAMGRCELENQYWRMARVRKGIGKMGGCGVGSGDCIPCL